MFQIAQNAIAEKYVNKKEKRKTYFPRNNSAKNVKFKQNALITGTKQWMKQIEKS
ncbi:MAG: hypothetical protein LBC12_07210 [Nitrososphaerota archaeon]|jgi:hypothetical protein|nr:hypothetical protein [Nitrososphaerota archaeon]